MPFTLTRSVRLTINPPFTGGSEAQPGVRGSGYSGHPRPIGPPRHYQFDVSCTAPLDPRTAYVRNIKDIDHAVHDAALPILIDACRAADRGESADAEPMVALHRIAGALRERLGPMLSLVRWRLTPFHDLELSMPPATPTTHDVLSAPGAGAAAPVATLRQRFDFSASHRLHNPALSDEENRAFFGKCNNPAGHGHNYVFEPCVEVAVDPRGRAGFSLGDMESVASRVLVDRFDHRNLNVDTPEFDERTGVMPSVENIAKVFFDLLAPAIASAGERPGAARLRSITVWETDRTCCTYSG